MLHRIKALWWVVGVCIVMALGACGGASPAMLTAGDGSKWVVDDKTGEPVKVGSWGHDAAGNVSNPKGDTEGAGKVKPTPRPDAAAGLYKTADFIGTVSRLLLLLSVAGLVASFFVPWLPRTTAIKGFVVALGLIVVQFWVTKYGVAVAEVSFWVTLVTAVGALVAVGYPWAVGLYNRNLINAGKSLAAKGDAQAGAALVIAGSPDDYKKPGEKSSLKTALAAEATAAP
jgi:hypothetical protein